MNEFHMFTDRASDYSEGRPLYAEKFMKELSDRFGAGEGTVAVDIGSGTGKFASQLLKLGCRVYGVEPNRDMRLEAEKLLGVNPAFSSVEGSASSLNLPSCSCDFITAAQAFHWFNPLEFRAECSRVLKPGGYVFLIWNMRDMNAEVNRKSFEIYKKYCPQFKGFAGGIQRNDERIRQFFPEYEVLCYDHPLYFTKEKFIKRSLSGSYSLKESDDFYTEYIQKLERLFETYSESGTLEMPNQTMVYVGTL